MNKDDEKGRSGVGKLWSGQQQKGREPERTAPADRLVFNHLDRAYKAFDLRDHAGRLEIRRAKDPTRFPAYHYLLDISYDPFHQSAFSLVYTFMVVTVNGWNLEPIVHAINFGHCERITEFDSKRHDKPAQGEPLIESIDIVTADEAHQEGSHRT